MQYRHLSLYEILGQLSLRNTNRKSWVADWSVSVPITFSDIEMRDGKGETLEDLRNYAPTVWPRTTIKFAVVTVVGEGRVGQTRPQTTEQLFTCKLGGRKPTHSGKSPLQAFRPNGLTDYYAALLPRRGPHIASHSVGLSVCLSVCPSVCPSVPFAEVVL